MTCWRHIAHISMAATEAKPKSAQVRLWACALAHLKCRSPSCVSYRYDICSMAPGRPGWTYNNLKFWHENHRYYSSMSSWSPQIPLPWKGLAVSLPGTHQLCRSLFACALGKIFLALPHLHHVWPHIPETSHQSAFSTSSEKQHSLPPRSSALSALRCA